MYILTKESMSQDSTHMLEKRHLSQSIACVMPDGTDLRTVCEECNLLVSDCVQIVSTYCVHILCAYWLRTVTTLSSQIVYVICLLSTMGCSGAVVCRHIYIMYCAICCTLLSCATLHLIGRQLAAVETFRRYYYRREAAIKRSMTARPAHVVSTDVDAF